MTRWMMLPIVDRARPSRSLAMRPALAAD